MTSLRFTGEWSPAFAFLVAAVLGAIAVWLYLRDPAVRAHRLRRWLVGTRVAVVVFVIVLLCGPVLRRVRFIGEVGKVFLLVDSSRSMALHDTAMAPQRKVQLFEHLRTNSEGGDSPAIERAARELIRASAALGFGPSAGSVEETALAFGRLSDVATAAAEHLAQAGSDTLATRLRAEVAEPARRYGGEARRATPQQLAVQTAELRATIDRWELEVATLADAAAQQRASGADAIATSIDQTTRWERLETSLVGRGLLERLAETHALEVINIGGGALERLWESDPVNIAGDDAATPTLGAAATNAPTDLGGGLQTLLARGGISERSAIVLFTDGRHNTGVPPETPARILGNRAIPVFTVGYGALSSPRDLAVLSVNAPDSVFIEDRARGDIVIRDDREAGQSFLAKIEAGGKTIWAETLKSHGQSPRRVPFEFAVRDLIQPAAVADLTNSAVPLAFTVTLTAVDFEAETNNNAGRFHFLAVSQRPKVLILDGRPRWEFRYLRNLFERDQQWDVNALIASTSASGALTPWKRGTKPGEFPVDRETLFGHHLILFGDLPPGYLGDEELGWIREFVEKRGGGVIFLDGRQEQLASYGTSPLAPLLPVGWSGPALEDDTIRMELTPDGAGSPTLLLSSDATENARLWGLLPTPRWVAPTISLPGSDVLALARLGERTVPLIATRRFGAGRVLYCAHEESWRWRYEVADHFHQRFWNQAFRRVMDAPYAVSDRRVSLDAGAAAFEPREKAELRMQVRDDDGRLTTSASVEVELYRDGSRISTLPMREQDEGSGVYRATTGELQPGEYELRPRVAGVPEDEIKARLRFAVEPRIELELADLTCNEELLRKTSAQSGGRHFREEHVDRLQDALAPLSRGRLEESETILWQSPWTFALIILLLTTEWILRKRAGLL